MFQEMIVKPATLVNTGDLGGLCCRRRGMICEFLDTVSRQLEISESNSKSLVFMQASAVSIVVVPLSNTSS